MSISRRMVWLISISILLISSIVLVIVWLWQPGQGNGDYAAIVAVPIMLATLAAAITGPLIPPRDPLELAQLAAKIAMAVSVERRRFLDQAIGMSPPARVGFIDPPRGRLTYAVEALLLRWQSLNGRHAGGIDSAAAFYGSLPTGRLVVLGAAGAGKTVLLSRMVLDLIDELPSGGLRPGDKVPVMLSLASFDVVASGAESSEELWESIKSWLGRSLIENYKVPTKAAASLVSDGWILPVLDGLDEMERPDSRRRHPRADAVIRGLNSAARPSVVLASREAEYGSSRTSDGQTRDIPDGILIEARHVVLQPVSPGSIAAYLQAHFPESYSDREQLRWTPIYEALAGGGKIVKTLGSPWRLFLAVTAYTSPTSDPKALLALTPAGSARHLLAQLIPATVRNSESARLLGWTADEVAHWLTYIAGLSARIGVQGSVDLPDLLVNSDDRRNAYISGPYFVAHLGPFASSVLIAIWVVSSGLGAWHNWYKVIVALLALTFAMGVAQSIVRYYRRFPLWNEDVTETAYRSGRIDLRRLSTSSGLRRMAAGSVLGIILGLASWWLLGGPALGLTDAYVLCITGALVTGLVGSLNAEIEAQRMPSAVARERRTYCLGAALVTGLPTGVIVGTTGGVLVGVMIGTISGIIGLMTTGNGYYWLRYFSAVRSAARQGRLPSRPTHLLEWCLTVGLMRMAGTNVEFRHRQLYDYLAAQGAQPTK